jgi:superoxide reductase
VCRSSGFGRPGGGLSAARRQKEHLRNNRFISKGKERMMTTIGEQFQTADWKSEKHVPVIECPDSVAADEMFDVVVTLGKEVSHPNTTEHHIRWIQLYFKPDDDKFAYQVGNFEFCAHGESVQGADQGPVCTHHGATASLKVNKPGTLFATALCNIHGLWENSKSLSLR